jgi:hypothetical protein
MLKIVHRLGDLQYIRTARGIVSVREQLASEKQCICDRCNRHGPVYFEFKKEDGYKKVKNGGFSLITKRKLFKKYGLLSSGYVCNTCKTAIRKKECKKECKNASILQRFIQNVIDYCLK